MGQYDSEYLSRIADSLDHIADTLMWFRVVLFGFMALGGIYLIRDVIEWFTNL